MHEVRGYALGLTNDLDHVEAFLNFFPQNPQLHLRQAVAHAAMDTEAEGQVLTNAP